MGGGDLNLKKSWHPQTLHNIEKVWKAEQKAEAEAKKIEQLQRELHEERQREEMQRYAVDQGIAKKKSDRLEWMYSAPGHAGVNHEDYLLGKAIDKAVDPLAINEEKNAEAPGASFMSNDSPSACNDLAAKIRDDPLFMIKKKETEKKKELLKNPVRMKQLQQMLKADLGKKGRKDKKDKKRKKEKKNRNSCDEDGKNTYRSKSSSKRRKGKYSESSEDSDRHETVDHTSRRKEKSYRNLEENGDMRNSSGYKYFNHEENGKRRRYSSSSEREIRLKEKPRKRVREKMNNSVRKVKKCRSSSGSKSPSPKRKSYRKESPPRKRQRDDSKLDDYSKERRYHTPNIKEGRRRHDKQRSARSPSPVRHSSREQSSSNSRSYAAKKPSESAAQRKMTDEERERRLAEMMDNAKWRDEQRGKNVKRYKEEDEAEKKENEQNTGKGASFVRPMKVQTYTSSTASVENRIKRNINSLQRTPAAMEKFLKK